MIRWLLILCTALAVGRQPLAAATLVSTGTVSSINDVTGVFGPSGSSLAGSAYSLTADTAAGFAELTINGVGFAFPNATIVVRAVAPDYQYVTLRAFDYVLNDSGYTNDILDLKLLTYTGGDPAPPPYVGPYCQPGRCGVSFSIAEYVAALPNCFGGCVPVNIASGVLAPATLAVEGAAVVVPEPAAWLLLILGFGASGAMLRARRGLAAAAG